MMGIPVTCLDCTELMDVPDYDTTEIECRHCGTFHEVTWRHYNWKGVRVNLPVDEED